VHFVGHGWGHIFIVGDDFYGPREAPSSRCCDRCSLLQCVVVCCSLLQYGCVKQYRLAAATAAVCCSVLQCAAVCCSALRVLQQK